mgnify:CR=1 FL=1
MEIEKNKRIITQIMFSISISLKFYFCNPSFVSTDEIGPMRRFKDVFYWTVTLSMNGSCHSGNRPRYLQHTARAYLKKENLSGVGKPFSDISDHVFKKNKLSITDGSAEIKELSHTSYSALLCHFSSTLKHTVGDNSGDRSNEAFQGWLFYWTVTFVHEWKVSALLAMEDNHKFMKISHRQHWNKHCCQCLLFYDNGIKSGEIFRDYRLLELYYIYCSGMIKWRKWRKYCCRKSKSQM